MNVFKHILGWVQVHFPDSPLRPSATTTEIATAAWVNNKIASAKTGRIEKVELSVGDVHQDYGYRILNAQLGDIIFYYASDIYRSYSGSFMVSYTSFNPTVVQNYTENDVPTYISYCSGTISGTDTLGVYINYFMGDTSSSTTLEIDEIFALRSV